MSQFFRRESDPLKEYGWIILVAALGVGGWLTMPMMSGTGSDSVRISGNAVEANEQSLSSLDSVENPQGAPGGVVEAAGTPSTAGRAGSMLYRPSEDAGSSEAVSEPAESAAPKGELAEAMARVAGAGKAPDNGWGGKSARSGFSRPKANFDKVGATREGGGGSTSAQFTEVDRAFGRGGDPGLDPVSAARAPGVPGRRRSLIDASGAGNQSLAGLRELKQAGLDSLKGNDESASGGGQRTFDASGARTSAMGQLEAAGAAPGLSGDAGVPMNLKATDPNKINKREFIPPEIKAASEAKGNDRQEMEKQMMMMFLQVALTGIMGPMGGAIGGMMSAGMGAGS